MTSGGAGPSRAQLARRLGICWRELRRGAGARELRRAIYGEDLDLGQVDALDILATMGACRSGELAAALRVDPSTATRAVDRLVDAGLAARLPCHGDRRAVEVTLTVQGEAAFERMATRATSALIEILEPFSASERVLLVTLLERMVDSLDSFNDAHSDPASLNAPVAARQDRPPTRAQVERSKVPTARDSR